MPGGLFGSQGTNDTLPPVASLALVFGGLILLTRVWVGFLGHLNRHQRLPRETRRAGRHDLGRAAAAGAAAVQPRRLHVCRTGRDGQPPHQPVLLRAQRARGYAVQSTGRLRLVGHRVAVRPDLPDGRRSPRPGLRPPDPGRPRAAPPPGGRRHRADGRRNADPGPLAQTRPGPRGAAGGGITTGPAVAAGGRPQRRPHGRAPGRRPGRGETLRHRSRRDPVRARGRREVPAALGVLFLGWVWAGPAAPTRRRIGHTAVAGLIALATMEVMALVSGTGWGWVRTTSTADASFTGVTPVNVVARAVSIVSHVLQVPISTMDVRPGLHGARAADRRLRRVPAPPALAPGRCGPLPRPDAAGPRAARTDRLVLVRHVGGGRARSRRVRTPPRRPRS